MIYTATISRHGSASLVTYFDFPDLEIVVARDVDPVVEARQHLLAHLEQTMAAGDCPTSSSRAVFTVDGREIVNIVVPLKLATAITIRRARLNAELSQRALSKQMGLAQPGLSKLEKSDANTSLETLEKLADALGCYVEISFKKR